MFFSILAPVAAYAAAPAYAPAAYAGKHSNYYYPGFFIISCLKTW